MKTVYSTGPGLYGVKKLYQEFPNPEKVHVLCARLEVYETTPGTFESREIKYETLVVKCLESRELAISLLILADSINANREALEAKANAQ